MTEGTAAEVTIHVRFAPNGAVTEISERPTDVAEQDWFNRLTRAFGTSYQPLSGGRAIFRASRSELDALKTLQ